MGSGLYASKLDEEDWVTFNNAQRAHYNYLEGVASILALEVLLTSYLLTWYLISTFIFKLLSGLFFPQFSAVVGVAYVIGRALYGIGYRSKGSLSSFDITSTNTATFRFSRQDDWGSSGGPLPHCFVGRNPLWRLHLRGWYWSPQTQVRSLKSSIPHH